MFIINALCCISDENQSTSNNKAKFIKKASPEKLNLQPTISSFGISDNNSQSQKENQIPIQEEKTPTFPQVIDSSQSFNSNKSYAGSDYCSLDDEVQEKFISPVASQKTQNTKNSLEFTPRKSNTFYGWDLADTQVKQWSIKDVLKFLAKVGLKKYHTTFYENKIKGKDLLTLTERQLREDLAMSQQDIRTINVYIQLLKQKSEREAKDKTLSKTFSGHRKQISLYRHHKNTYSCRKILHLVKNPIMEEEGEQQNGQSNSRKQNYTTKDLYESTNLSELMTN